MPVVDARVVVLWAVPGGQNVNTVIARFNDDNVSVQGVADSIRDGIQTHWIPLMCQTASLTEVQVGDDIGGAVAPSSAVGANANPSENPSVALHIVKVCNSGRNGRWFVPALPETATDDMGQITSSFRSAWQSAIDSFLADCEAAGVDFRVEQKDGSLAEVDSFNVRPFVGLQKRRYNRVRG